MPTPQPPCPADPNVPKAVINRLSLYLRELQQLIGAGQMTISSTRLGRRLGFTASQVRKDFAYFGQFGYPGLGYRCDQLVAEIRRILGTDRTWNVVLVGCGNLGQALLGYRGFGSQGFQVVAAVDVNPNLVGTKIETIPIGHLDHLKAIAEVNQIEVAILAVPSAAVELAVKAILAAGIRGIWRR